MAGMTRSEEVDDSVRSRALHLEMSALARRDMELWCIGLLAIVVLLVGVLSAVFPRLSAIGRFQFDLSFLPQLMCGLVALVLLLSVYLIDQRKTLHHKAQALVREMAYAAQLEKLAFIDSATQLFTDAYLPHLLDVELKRANLEGTHISFLVLSVCASSGQKRAEHQGAEVARLLRSTFRGSDTILHHGRDRFLVVMPETAETQALNAVQRLMSRVDQWNMNTLASEMSVRYGLSSYSPGGDASYALLRAEARVDALQHPPAVLFTAVTPLQSNPATAEQP